ncbi:MAG: ABC transporter permease [Faecalibacterium sp.]|nr:ABC transporter permease [Ruminococcus sp.]MCM1391731.1 ABC transporter permease [Ruminococcus sp.]MCM1485356.1 ABC transporter permease [Faecalibacterium sp.]
MSNKAVKEPFIRISKRTEVSTKLNVIVRAVAIILALIVCAVVLVLITGGKMGITSVYGEIFKGAFGTIRRFKVTLSDTAALLCLGLALAPAFKMRFWNIGAEGQALIGALASAAMIKLCPGVPNIVMIIMMFIASIISGAIWGIIPAFFKAQFKTNETLFTLMMNYVAIQLTKFFIVKWEKTPGSSLVGNFSNGIFPKLFGVDYGWNYIIVAVLMVALFIYLKYSKQGYEIAVVGESENTARYVGISVKKVIIRTMAISGALCGIAGFMLVGGVHHTITSSIVDGNGFTAIVVAWLSKFNPIIMFMVSFLLSFLGKGTEQIASSCNLNDHASDIIIGIVLFFILGCEFFVNYKITFRNSKSEKEAK